MPDGAAADPSAGQTPIRVLATPSLSSAGTQEAKPPGEGAAVHVLTLSRHPRPAALVALAPNRQSLRRGLAHRALRPSPSPSPQGPARSWAATQMALDTTPP